MKKQVRILFLGVVLVLGASWLAMRSHNAELEARAAPAAGVMP